MAYRGRCVWRTSSIARRYPLVVAVRRSKGDQEGRGAEKGIPYASNPGGDDGPDEAGC